LIDIIGRSPSGFCGGLAFDPRQALTGRWFSSKRKPFWTEALSPTPDSVSSSLVDMKFNFVVFLHIC
jgi:hypothetical protein